MDELLLKLKILGWKLDPHFTNGHRRVYDHPDQEKYLGVWLAFYTDEDHRGTISIACKTFIDDLPIITEKVICEQTGAEEVVHGIRKNSYKDLCAAVDRLEE